MDIYNKLTLDVQEHVDKCVWDMTKKNIPEIELKHRKLRLLLQELQYELTIQERLIIDWLCWEVIKPRIYGEEFNICDDCDTTVYSIDINNKNPLYKIINKWVYYLETKTEKPTYKSVFDKLKLAIDHWVSININNNVSFQNHALNLGMNIPDMYDIFLYDNDVNQHFSCHDIFAHSILDIVGDIIIKSFDYGILTDDESSDEDSFDSDDEESIDSDDEFYVSSDDE